MYNFYSVGKMKRKLFVLVIFVFATISVFWNMTSVVDATGYTWLDATGGVTGVQDYINGEDIQYYGVIKTSTMSNDDSISLSNNVILEVDHSGDRWLKGIEVGENVTLKIQLKSGDLYVYGQQKGKIFHAGIEVASNAKLIIEKVSDSAGKLVAVGACGTAEQGKGTGAGIGGSGYAYDSSDKNLGTYQRNESNCGTIIIRSGDIWACGGTSFKDDGVGTGAGIGGGGIYVGDTGSSNVSQSVAQSGHGGTVKIYGGTVRAIGGGTANKNSSVYKTYKDILFNTSKGFSSHSNVSSLNSNKRGKGTGAGIGSGGIFAGDDCHFIVSANLKFYHYGGAVFAVAGGGYDGNDDSVSGQGASIGTGGIYTSADCPELDMNNTNFGKSGDLDIKFYDGDNLYTRSNSSYNQAISDMSASSGNKVIEAIRQKTVEGPGVFVGYGGYNDEEDNETKTLTGRICTEYSSSYTLTKYCASWPTDAFSDYTAPTYSFEYAVAKKDESTGYDIAEPYFADTIEEAIQKAITAAGTDKSQYFSDAGKIYKEKGYNIFTRVTISDKTATSNYEYSILNSGIKRVKVSGSSIMRNEILGNDSASLDTTPKHFEDDRTTIAVLSAEGSPSYRIAQPHNGNYFITKCQVYLKMLLDTQISIETEDLAGYTVNIGIASVDNYFVDAPGGNGGSGEEPGDTIDYGTEQAGPSNLPALLDINNPTQSGTQYTYDHVYFGNTPSTGDYYSKSQPIKWRVLNKKGNDNSNSLFVLTEYTLLEKELNVNGGQIWTNNPIRKLLFNSVYKDCFTDKEKGIMHLTTKSESGSTTWGYFTAAASSLSSEKLFLLSVKEASNNSYGFNAQLNNTDANRKVKKGSASGEDGDWWLRSACVETGSEEGEVSFIDSSGQALGGYGSSVGAIGVRAGLNIPILNIIYAFDGASDGNATDLTAISETKPDTYRLTIYDNGRSGFGTTATTITKSVGEPIELGYSGAKSGTGEYITVLIKDSNGNGKYIGRYACSSASGSISITLPTDMEAGTYTVIMVNEHNNGQYKTNYGGFSSSITLNVQTTDEPTPTDTPTPTDEPSPEPVPQGLPGWWNIAQESYVCFGNVDTTKSYPTKAANDTTNKANYESLYGFGEDKEAISWTVISKKANDNNKTDALFMVASPLIKRRFNAEGNNKNSWSDSELKAVLQNNVLTDCFSIGERNAMLNTTKTETQDVHWRGSRNALKSNLSSEKLFILSAQEIVYEMSYGFIPSDSNWDSNPSFEDEEKCWTIADKINYVENWWLRSSINDTNNKEVATINENGYTSYKEASTGDMSVVPATNIKATSIICAFYAYDDGEETCNDYGDGKVAYFEDINDKSVYGDSGMYRLTIYDDTRSAFSASLSSGTVAPNEEVSIQYSNAQTGDNEYISVVIKELGMRATLKHETPSGTIKVQLPNNIVEGTQYTMIVYNEQNNGARQTNYGRHSIVMLNGSGNNPDNPDIPQVDDASEGGASDTDLVRPNHIPAPVTALTLDITVNPASPEFTVSTIQDTVANVTSLVLKDDDKGFSKVNWDLNKKVNWDLGSNGVAKKLVYKDVGTTTSPKNIATLFDKTANMDVVATVNSKPNGVGYGVAVYNADDNTVTGKKGYEVSETSGTNTINNSAKDYMHLVGVSGTKGVTLQKTEGGTTITDIPYEVNGNITISACTQDTNDKKKITITLEPASIITGQHIKEIGVRAEYTQNGVTASRVKKTNQIDSENGSYTFIFPNLPSSPTFTAYYINVDNEEISTVA